VHLPDFRAIAAVKSARRYKVINGNIPGLEAWPYIAAYEIETDDMAAVSKQFQTALRPFDPTLDRARSANVMAIQISEDV
ncbi:MAG: hypothetical protein RL367_1645, partial [Pseudomonadota bacterium]